MTNLRRSLCCLWRPDHSLSACILTCLAISCTESATTGPSDSAPLENTGGGVGTPNTPCCSAVGGSDAGADAGAGGMPAGATHMGTGGTQAGTAGAPLGTGGGVKGDAGAGVGSSGAGHAARAGGSTGSGGRMGTGGSSAELGGTSLLLSDAGTIPDVCGDGACPASTWPTEPPARICDNAALLTGPATAPTGATVVPAGDNSGLDFTFRTAGTTFWFAPGVHTLGSDEYGQIIPGDNTTFLGGPGAVLDGKGINRSAFTQHAKNVRIAYLEIRNFISPNDQGVVNHDGGEGWTIEYNYMHDNEGAAVFVSTNCKLQYNCLRDNGQYGFQGIGPGGGGSGVDLLVDHNEIAHNDTGDWEHKGDGCGCTGGAKFWDVDGAVITNNWVHDNLSVGLWADTNDRNFVVEGNYIENNWGEGFFYEISYNAIVRNNTLKRNTLGKGKEFAARNDNFPVASIYLSESGGDSRVSGSGTLEIDHNYFEDNWGGVTLWENADRFCN